MNGDPYFVFEVDGLHVIEYRAIKTNHLCSRRREFNKGLLGRGRGLFIILRANVFHDRKLPR